MIITRNVIGELNLNQLFLLKHINASHAMNLINIMIVA